LPGRTQHISKISRPVQPYLIMDFKPKRFTREKHYSRL
jgi:hypothetical protein